MHELLKNFRNLIFSRLLLQDYSNNTIPIDIIFIPINTIFYFISFAQWAGSPQQLEPVNMGPYQLTHPVNCCCGSKANAEKCKTIVKWLIRLQE